MADSPFIADVQCFLGFANFYCKFIQDYSKLIFPLTQLTKKGQSFVWSKEADTDFVSLKKAFTSFTILDGVDPKKLFIMEVGVSDFALGSILSHPVAFHSRKFDTVEITYKIH